MITSFAGTCTGTYDLSTIIMATAVSNVAHSAFVMVRTTDIEKWGLTLPIARGSFRCVVMMHLGK